MFILLFAQRNEHYQGVQPIVKYLPTEVAKTFSQKRIVGLVYVNMCTYGEALFTKDLDLYIDALVTEGHYIEVMTNMTISPMLDKILALGKEKLKHFEFKYSFHYLEAKKRNLLNRFVDNVNRA